MFLFRASRVQHVIFAVRAITSARFVCKHFMGGVVFRCLFSENDLESANPRVPKCMPLRHPWDAPAGELLEALWGYQNACPGGCLRSAPRPCGKFTHGIGQDASSRCFKSAAGSTKWQDEGKQLFARLLRSEEMICGSALVRNVDGASISFFVGCRRLAGADSGL